MNNPLQKSIDIMNFNDKIFARPILINGVAARTPHSKNQKGDNNILRLPMCLFILIHYLLLLQSYLIYSFLLFKH